jgi:hypothetical protein
MHRPISRGVGSNMLLTNNIGDGSTLTLDFMSGVLDSRLSFARASTGTFIGSNGYVQTAVANQPRFDYDPVTLACRGLLIEGAATNLATYSEDYSQAVWTKNNVNRTTGQSSPDNQTGATLLEENTTAFVKHGIERSPTITPGVHTFSVWVKEPATNSRRYVCIQIADGQATAARYTIVADLQSGTITASGANNGSAGAPTNTSHSISAFVSGWYRLTITMNCVASPVYPAVMLSNISTLYGGNNQPFYSAAAPYLGLIVWGAQLETGSGITSYIPTAGSTVTRSSDHCTMAASSFITGSPYPQTLLIDCIPQSASVSFPDLIRLFDRSGPTFSYGNEIYYFGASTMSLQRKITATSPTDITMSSSLAYNTRYRIATSISSTAFLGSRNGVTGSGSTGAPAVLTSSVTHLGIGCNGDSSPVSVMFGTIRQVKFWPVAFDQTTLNGLTTL